MVFNWITGFVACLFFLSFLLYVHNATYLMMTYLHWLFTKNTCNRISWIWGCKPQSDTTTGNMHTAVHWLNCNGTMTLSSNFSRSVCNAWRNYQWCQDGHAYDTWNSRAHHAIYQQDSKARKLEAPADCAKWSMHDFRRYVVAAILKPFFSVLMNMTGHRTVRAADYQQHVEYCLQVDSGMAQQTCFIDLCCSKTIIWDRNLLKKVWPMNVSAHAAGLIRTKNITHHADLYLPVKNIDGTMTIITVEGVYYDPTVNYNVVSVTELANLNFESRFGKHQSSVHAQRECTEKDTGGVFLLGWVKSDETLGTDAVVRSLY